MPFDKASAAKWITKNALPPFGNHKCATYVRQALEAGGLNAAAHPARAKDWGPTLVCLGFRPVSAAGYIPSVGDVIVMKGTSASVSGHIELYDGTNWVSDFVQREIWPGPSYRSEKPKYQIFRYCF